MNKPRKATATKGGKIHYAYENMSLCLQYVGNKNELINEEVNCKRCLKKFDKLFKVEG